jgi:nitrite reductase/ring-hydroxylating ferredoxin subunit
MDTIAVGAEDSFADGKFVLIESGRHSIGVVRLRDGQYKAVRNWCPHKGAPICRGIVGGTWAPSAPGELTYERDGEVLVCPWHGFQYDLNNGKELYQDVPTQLRMFPVEVRDGTVYVTV